MTLRETVHTGLTGTALAFVAAALVFGFWTEADLATSALFATEAGNFPANHNALLSYIRHFFWNGLVVFALFALAMVTIQLLFRPVQRIATRVWGFVVLSFAIGPGLLVNGLLKEYWGRARPRDIEAFGGDASFTPALSAARECLDNCSFVSGEASGLFTAAMVLTLLLLPGLEDRASRIWAALVIWVPATLGAILRISMGAHFLSDVVFALIFSSLLTLALFLAMRLDEHLAGATLTNAGRDVREIVVSALEVAREIPRRFL